MPAKSPRPAGGEITFLARNRKAYIITLIPAIFMTVVCTSFLVVSPQAFGQADLAPWSVLIVIAVAVIWFAVWLKKDRERNKISA